MTKLRVRMAMSVRVHGVHQLFAAFLEGGLLSQGTPPKTHSTTARPMHLVTRTELGQGMQFFFGGRSTEMGQ